MNSLEESEALSLIEDTAQQPTIADRVLETRQGQENLKRHSSHLSRHQP